MADEITNAGDLAQSYKEGDRASGEALVRLVRDGLHGFIAWKFPGHSHIEDVVQESICRAVAALHDGRLDDAHKFKPFLWSTAKFVAMEMSRGGFVDRTVTDTEWVEQALDQKISGADTLFSDAMMKAVEDVLDSLRPPEYVDLLRRRYYQQTPKIMTCEELGLTPKSYDLKISRARGKFVAAFKKQYPIHFADWKTTIICSIAALLMWQPVTSGNALARDLGSGAHCSNTGQRALAYNVWHLSEERSQENV